MNRKRKTQASRWDAFLSIPNPAPDEIPIKRVADEFYRIHREFSLPRWLMYKICLQDNPNRFVEKIILEYTGWQPPPEGINPGLQTIERTAAEERVWKEVMIRKFKEEIANAKAELERIERENQ